MRLLPRALPLVLLLPVLALAGLTTPAHADPVPGMSDLWPRCHQGTDTDGEYCIVSVTKNGVPVPPVDYSVPGSYVDAQIDLIGAGDVRFGLTDVQTFATDPPVSTPVVSPADTYVYTVNTGAIDPVEMYGTVRDTDLSFGGSAASGHTFTLTFKPSPMAWKILDPTFVCGFNEGCGDDTTVADTVYDGFVTGYVTDDASSGLGAAEIADRQGYIQSTNAQSSYPFYDIDTNTLEIRMANPHLESPGVPATGYYDTFLPHDYLVNQMQVPDPSVLSTGTVTVVRAGSSTSVPFTLTHEGGGVRIHISGITFSRPKYKIHPKPSAPGVPRWGAVHRLSHHAVRVSFRRPLANGGRQITSYDARCRRGTGAWHVVSGSSSPLVVRNLTRKPVSCQVRAVNRIGHGKWSRLRRQS